MEAAAAVLPSNPDRILIGYLFQQVYTLADRVIVGQFVGTDAFSAVGSTTAITSMFMSMCMGASNGAGVVVAQYHGAGKVKRVSEGLQSALVVSTIVSVAVAVIFWIFGHPIMGIFVNNDTMISIAATGIRITSSFFIALGAVQILRFLLSGAGDAGFTLVNGIVEIVVRITLVFLLTGEAVLGKW